MISYLDNFVSRLEEQSGAKAVTLISQAKGRLVIFVFRIMLLFLSLI